MDVFRSATLAIAVILLIFMAMIMYYEFKVNKGNIKYPPYSSECPDYSYEYDYGGNVGVACRFNDSFVDNCKKLNNTFDSTYTGALCSSVLRCQYPSNPEFVDCKYSSNRENPSKPNEMMFLLNKNKHTNRQNIKKCHLTLDGIV